MSAAEQLESPPLSVRQELDRYISEIYKTEEELPTGQLINRILDQTEGDEVFRDALLLQGLRLLVPEIANSVRHRLRVQARNGNGGENSRERFSHVFGFVGDQNKSFLVMTRREHLFAAEQLERGAKGYLRLASLHRAAAALLQDDEQLTGDVLSDYELETLENHWLNNENPPVPWLSR